MKAFPIMLALALVTSGCGAQAPAVHDLPAREVWNYPDLSVRIDAIAMNQHQGQSFVVPTGAPIVARAIVVGLGTRVGHYKWSSSGGHLKEDGSHATLAAGPGLYVLTCAVSTAGSVGDTRSIYLQVK